MYVGLAAGQLLDMAGISGHRLGMRGIPVSERCRVSKVTVLYVVGLLHTAVYRPTVLIYGRPM